MFVTLEEFVKEYPMRNMGEAYNALNNFCVSVGLPLLLVTNNPMEEYGGNSDMVWTEPHSPWQNIAELEIRDLKNISARLRIQIATLNKNGIMARSSASVP